VIDMSVPRLDEERCENLRWKGLFVGIEPDPRFQPSDDACWCLETQPNFRTGPWEIGVSAGWVRGNPFAVNTDFLWRGQIVTNCGEGRS